MKTNFLTIAVVIIISLLLVSCTQQSENESVNTQIQAVLKNNLELKNVQVALQNDIAVLSGTVKSDIDKANAIYNIQWIDGVSEVNADNLNIVNTESLDKLTIGVREILQVYPSVNAIITDSTVMLSGNITKANLEILKNKIQVLQPKNIVTKNIIVE
ncbi:MAG: hypothetical protein ACK5NK_16675 [Niabella sp.]